MIRIILGWKILASHTRISYTAVGQVWKVCEMRRKLLCTISLITTAALSCLYLLDGGSMPEVFGTSPVVTIVLPTKCRPSLDRAIRSLLKQTNNRWLAVIMLNGGECHEPRRYMQAYSSDPQAMRQLDFKYVNDSIVSKNCAGEVRNLALQYVSTSWVGFLDDDDTLAPQYVDSLILERSISPMAKLISFRMYHVTNEIYVPPADLQKVTRGRIGISFAYELTNTVSDKFIPGITEDFDFIYNFCLRSGRECVLSDKVTYFVKGSPSSTAHQSIGNRSPMEFAELSYETTIKVDRELCKGQA